MIFHNSHPCETPAPTAASTKITRKAFIISRIVVLELVSSRSQQLKIDPGLILRLSEAENLTLHSSRLNDGLYSQSLHLFIVAHEMPAIVKKYCEISHLPNLNSNLTSC